MTESLRRGACPTLSAPMQTGDGLLARLNPVASGLTPAALIGLCEAALRHGNGVVEVTSRGSFQIRGLTQRSSRRLAEEVDVLGIEVRTGVPVVTGPLAGLDPMEIADPRPLVQRIREDIGSAGLGGRLGPKVSVIVDGGGRSGLEAISSDVRLTASKGVLGLVWRLASPSHPDLQYSWGYFTEDHARKATLSVLKEIAAAQDSGRAWALPIEQFTTLFGRSPDRIEPKPRAHALSPGCLPLVDDRSAAATALPFGHTRAETLIDLVKAAEATGSSEIRLAPKRTLLFLCPSEASAHTVLEAADIAGFVTHLADPRTRIAACPGSPACASGHIPARAMAAEVAAAMAADLGVELHISGCAKRCAAPRANGLTLLGKPDSAALVLGAPGATPLAHVAHEHGGAAIGRVLALIADERKPGVPDERRMHQLGKARLATAFRGEE